MLTSSISPTEAMPTPTWAMRRMTSWKRSRSSAARSFESVRPLRIRGFESDGSVTAAATTGPANGATPASSIPHTTPLNWRSWCSVGHLGSGVRTSINAMVIETTGRWRISLGSAEHFLHAVVGDLDCDAAFIGEFAQFGADLALVAAYDVGSAVGHDHFFDPFLAAPCQLLGDRRVADQLARFLVLADHLALDRRAVAYVGADAGESLFAIVDPDDVGHVEDGHAAGPDSVADRRRAGRVNDRKGLEIDPRDRAHPPGRQRVAQLLRHGEIPHDLPRLFGGEYRAGRFGVAQREGVVGMRVGDHDRFRPDIVPARFPTLAGVDHDPPPSIFHKRRRIKTVPPRARFDVAARSEKNDLHRVTNQCGLPTS